METCPTHENINHLILCMEPDCWEIICSECLHKHFKAKHKNSNIPQQVIPKQDLKIKSIRKVQSEIVNFLHSIKYLYQKELMRLENFLLKFNRDYEDNLEKIRSSKEKVLDLVIHLFQRIEENYKTKVNLDEVNHRCEDLIEQIKSGLNNVDLYQNCFSDTYNYEKDFKTLELLVKQYGTNELGQQQYNIVTNVHDLSSKLKECSINVEVDESKLYSTGSELSKFIKVTEGESVSKSNGLLIESSTYFAQGVQESLHFFEDGTRNLHLYHLNQPLKSINSPQHELITLANNNFLIPSGHRSITTPQGDIFFTGGADDRTGRATAQCYKLDFEQKSLTSIDLMLKPRNNHGIAYLDGFLYVVGGVSNEEGSLTTCERYGVNEGKAWEKIASLNVAAHGACVATFRERLLYKIGGKKNSRQLANTIEVYNVENNTWTVIPFQCETQFDKRNFTLPCFAAAAQINHNEILVLGGCDENGTNLVQTFIFHIDDKESSQKNFTVREVNKRPLPEPECFDMGQVVISNHNLYCLQNSPIQALGYTTVGGPMSRIKKLLTFADSHWFYIKH